MDDKPYPYWPSEDDLQQAGFYEGYGDLWVYDGPGASAAAIDMDEYGTMGCILVNGAVTHSQDIESLADINQLIEAVNAPF